MSSVLVIGGGPAGMFAAYHAAKNGHSVTLLEQNEKLGKKLYITGKGRCNLTNAGDMENLFAHVVTNSKFLYSAFYGCDNAYVMDFFKNNGMPIKVERGNRVFPVSDHSSDVIVTLKKALEEAGVKVKLFTRVVALLVEKLSDDTSCIKGVELADKTKLYADYVILATGGLSYPSTGATGDGYTFAKTLGMKVMTCSPSLVPLETVEDWPMELQGLALKNVAIRIYNGKKVKYEDFGEMLFTHFGVSGPMILSASAAMKYEFWQDTPTIYIDLKPALDIDQLDKRVLKDFEETKNKAFKNAIVHLFPGKMVPVMIELSGIDPEKKVNEISKEERQQFVALIKKLPITIAGTRGWNEAIITKGGISVKEINPSTMESKKIKGLYVCGEVLDLDAYTGGYNLQIAWSTGYIAGNSVGGNYE